MPSTLLNSQKAQKDHLLLLLTGCFFFTLYLPSMPVVNNICTALIVAFSFFYNSWREKWLLLKERKAIQLMLLFFLVHIVSCFLSENQRQGFRMLEMRSPLLLFPISLGLILINHILRDRILFLFSVITTCAALYCLIRAFLLYSMKADAALLYNDSLTDAIKMQSIYFAMLVNLAIFGFIHLLISRTSFIKYRWLMYAGIFFLLIINFLLASRIAMGILYSSLVIGAFYYVIKKRKFLEGATLLLGLMIGVFMLIKFFPKTVNRFRELTYTEYNYKSNATESHYNMEVNSDQWNGANIRLAVWQCGWELSRERLLFGWQLGDKEDRLHEKYLEKNFEFAYKTDRNMHNTYLDVLSTFGITGLIIFVLAYVMLPLWRNRVSVSGDASNPGVNYKGLTTDGYSILVVAAFAVSMFTETYIDRSLGNILLGFFISFTQSLRD